MPTITRVSTGNASIDDVNQLIDLLEGTSGYELAFLLRCIASSDFTVRLADAAGARSFIIQDSAGVQVASINSDGDITISGAFTPATLNIPTATGPSQTADGRIVWDSDDDRLTVGTGAATKVIGLSRGAGSDASATQELMYDTTADELKVWDGSASAPVTKLPNIIQQFVETSGQKGFFALGAPANLAYTTGLWVGAGFSTLISATSGAITGTGTVNVGSWQFSTGATSGEFGLVSGPLLDDAQDWTMVWRGVIPSAASQEWFFGAKTNASAADENNIIAFRVSGTGNIFGVCDSSGTETTRDSGATGATECTLRIEVRSAGTIVRFYRNNVQIGADVTTNIPTGNLIAVNGIRNTTTADKVSYTYDLYGWREV